MWADIYNPWGQGRSQLILSGGKMIDMFLKISGGLPGCPPGCGPAWGNVKYKMRCFGQLGGTYRLLCVLAPQLHIVIGTGTKQGVFNRSRKLSKGAFEFCLLHIKRFRCLNATAMLQ